MKVIKESCYKGTRILVGNEKRIILDRMIDQAIELGYTEINMPIIQPESMFTDKVGKENNNLMYTFKDRGNRDLCLAPEYTSVIQNLAKTTFKQEKDVRLFYVQECFRGEKPQAGRYRQFTQFGVEILNPTMDHKPEMLTLIMTLLKATECKTYSINTETARGLDYYKEGVGFEVNCSALGSSSQVCGGGAYDGGIGFALGIDRLI